MFYYSGDITAFKGDAIVNSLGAYERIHVPGGLYHAILRAVNDPQALNQEVCSIGEPLPFCSVFTTGNYGLPCKTIIHAITPFYFLDHNLTLITKCFHEILDLAAKLKLKSICIPMIGTGANGYPTDQVYAVVRKICREFNADHPEIDIHINTYSVEHPSRNDNLLYEETMEWFYRHRDAIPMESSRIIESSERPIRINRASGSDSAYIPPKETEKPKAQRESFLKQIGIEFEDSFATLVRKIVFSRTKGTKKVKEEALADAWDDINTTIGDFKNGDDPSAWKGQKKSKSLMSSHAPQYEWKKNKKRKNEGEGYVWLCPNKAEILLTCIALGLNAKQTKEVYEFSGYALSPYNRYDDAFRYCLEKLGHENAWGEILKDYQFRTSESIYAYPERRRRIFVDEGEEWK